MTDAKICFYSEQFMIGHIPTSRIAVVMESFRQEVHRLSELTSNRVLFVRTTTDIENLQCHREQICDALVAFGFQARNIELIQFVKGECPISPHVFSATGKPDGPEEWQGCKADWDHFAEWLRVHDWQE